MKEDYVLCL